MVINGLASKGSMFRARQRRKETARATELAEDCQLKVELPINQVLLKHAPQRQTSWVNRAPESSSQTEDVEFRRCFRKAGSVGTFMDCVPSFGPK